MLCLLKNPLAAPQLVSKGCVKPASVQCVLVENAFPFDFPKAAGAAGLVFGDAEGAPAPWLLCCSQGEPSWASPAPHRRRSTPSSPPHTATEHFYPCSGWRFSFSLEGTEPMLMRIHCLDLHIRWDKYWVNLYLRWFLLQSTCSIVLFNIFYTLTGCSLEE